MDDILQKKLDSLFSGVGSGRRMHAVTDFQSVKEGKT
jgi:hypothetical protein